MKNDICTTLAVAALAHYGKNYLILCVEYLVFGCPTSPSGNEISSQWVCQFHTSFDPVS